MPIRDLHVALFAFAAALFVSCASTRDPIDPALQQGRVPAFTVPESLTVDLDVRVHQKGAPPFSARLYARPHHQYRIDVFGFASQVVASWFWTEGRWTLSLKDRAEILEGTGDSLSLDVEGVSLRLPSVHALFGFIWSEPGPGLHGPADSSLTLRYGPYRRFGDRILPGEAEVFINGESRMVLRVKKIQDHPVWKKDPFFQPVH